MTGEQIKLHSKDVLFVLDLNGNFLSCSGLTKNGFSVQCDCPTCITKKETHICGVANFVDGVYLIGDVNMKFDNLSRKEKESGQVWHQCFGNVEEQCRTGMMLNSAVSCMDSNVSPAEGSNCECSIMGKMTILSLKSRSSKDLQPGDLIYSDFCGPLLVEGLGVCRYFCTFSDAASGYRSMEILQRK